MLKILLPQSIAAMLPALIAQMVIALKDSALGYQICYVEVVRSGTQVASANRNYIPSLIVVVVIMIAINYALSVLAPRIEQALRTGPRPRREARRHGPEQRDQTSSTKTRAVSAQSPGTSGASSFPQ